MKKKKRPNFFVRLIRKVVVLAIIFLAAVLATKYYFYDSDYSVDQTNLEAVSIDGIKLGMNISQVDTSIYTQIDTVVDKCDYNFEELSIKVNSKGEITYIIASYYDVDLQIGQTEEDGAITRFTGIYSVLGDNYKTESYNSDENNYWKIAKYVDSENDIYLGIVYSRYNNEISKVILSSSSIKST